MTQYWTYQNSTLDEAPEGYEGFVYRITNETSGKFYIGKKSFWSRTTKRVPGKVRKKHITKESNWKDYWSSSPELKAEVKKVGKRFFKREVLELCGTKRDLTYKEVWWQFKFGVLENDTYNGNILGRFFKNL